MYIAIEPKQVHFEWAEEEPLDLERMMIDLGLLWSLAASFPYTWVTSALHTTRIWLMEHPQLLVEAGVPQLWVEASKSCIVSRPIAPRHMSHTGGCQLGWNSHQSHVWLSQLEVQLPHCVGVIYGQFGGSFIQTHNCSCFLSSLSFPTSERIPSLCPGCCCTCCAECELIINPNKGQVQTFQKFMSTCFFLWKK